MVGMSYAGHHQARLGSPQAGSDIWQTGVFGVLVFVFGRVWWRSRYPCCHPPTPSPTCWCSAPITKPLALPEQGFGCLVMQAGG